MPSTIEQAVHPLFLTAFVLGLGIYSPKKRYIKILCNMTIWIIYGCIYYYIVIEHKVKIWFQSIFNIIYTQISIFAIITSIIMTVYHDKVCIMYISLIYNKYTYSL